MLLRNIGEKFEYNGVTYIIGKEIVCTEESDEYADLTGYITEIRDGADKETENTTPDIYCSLNESTTPEFVKEIERRFSESYCEAKTLDELCFDSVIMAPDMIRHGSK